MAEVTCSRSDEDVHQIKKIEGVIERKPKYSKITVQNIEGVSSRNQDQIVGDSEGNDSKPIVIDVRLRIENETGSREKERENEIGQGSFSLRFEVFVSNGFFGGFFVRFS